MHDLAWEPGTSGETRFLKIVCRRCGHMFHVATMGTSETSKAALLAYTVENIDRAPDCDAVVMQDVMSS